MYVHVFTYQRFFVLIVVLVCLFSTHGHGDILLLLGFFFLYSYQSQLKLVRLKVSESGVYTFLASNGDASIHLTFEVHVLSKFLGNIVVFCERNQCRIVCALLIMWLTAVCYSVVTTVWNSTEQTEVYTNFANEIDLLHHWLFSSSSHYWSNVVPLSDRSRMYNSLL